MKIDSIKNYHRLFQTKSMPYIMSDIFGSYYKRLRCLLIFYDNTWTSFLLKKTAKITLSKGLKFYCDKNLFNKYKREFKNYKLESQKFFKKIIKNRELTKNELIIFFDFARNFFRFYSKTEFFYTDKAFLLSGKDIITKQNLTSLEKIKKTGRQYLNKLFFGSESYLSKLIEILSKQFKISEKELIAYGIEELIKLFDNQKISEKLIKNRLQSFMMIGDGKFLRKIDGRNAELLAVKFYSREVKTTNVIQGVCANPGKAIGSVKIILSDYRGFDNLREIIGQMGKGNILVAETTSPELMPACRKANAIITNQGGLLSHAAIVSRELNIPCIVGVGDATKVLKDGDIVEVDANNGLVKILKRAK